MSASPSIEQLYHYCGPSALEVRGAKADLYLATSNQRGAHPYFFQGSIAQPSLVAPFLALVGTVARSRFFTPPGMLQRIIALADPVVTSSEGALRFESFSLCCGVYARLDLFAGAFNAAMQRCGTTNVDFGFPLRNALLSIPQTNTLNLSVGRAQLELDVGKGVIIERKVALPRRWLKGFLEVQEYQRNMRLIYELDSQEAARFFQALPKRVTAKTAFFLAPHGTGLRLSQAPHTNSIKLQGVDRLLPLASLLHELTVLRIYATAQKDTTAWVLSTPHFRLTYLVSAEPYRGLSGEGQALESLLTEELPQISRLRAALSWQKVLSIEALAMATGISTSDLEVMLARIAATGGLGFDLTENSFFKRELPFELSQIQGLNPRLEDAKKLVAEGNVRFETLHGDSDYLAWVRSAQATHRVENRAGSLRCTCAWYGKHQLKRGPCKHILACGFYLREKAASKK